MGTAQETWTNPGAADPRGRGSARRGSAAPRDDEVYRITDAPTALSEDISRRARRYMIQMIIRTACFLLAVFIPGPLRWVFLVGAVFLPWVAVLLANAGREADRGPGAYAVVPEPVAYLEAGPTGRAPSTDPASPPGQSDPRRHGGAHR